MPAFVPTAVPSARIRHALDVVPAGFSINADAGATYPAATVTAATSTASGGDIIIAHSNHLWSKTGPGLGEALTRVAGRGHTFGRPGRTVPA